MRLLWPKLSPVISHRLRGGVLWMRWLAGLGVLCAWLLAPGVARASHIAGADLTYRCLGNNRYEVTFVMYLDCENANPGVYFDDPLLVYVFNGDNGAIDQVLVMTNPIITAVVPQNVAACLSGPLGLCLEEGIYRDTITLASRPSGYTIGWTRCCRNGVIRNLANPGDVGVTLSSFIPNPGLGCNSLPVFNRRPPLFICNGQTLTYDHSATDPDGDSLVYAITRPYTGLNTNNVGTGTGQNGQPPAITSINPPNPMGPPPYRQVPYQPGFNAPAPFGATNGSFCTIDAQTGMLNIQPQGLGLYVVGISVFEYRNGQLIAENKRDVQFAVVTCNNFGQPPVIQSNRAGLPFTNDTLTVPAERPFCYRFRVTDLDTSDNLDAQVSSITTSLGATLTVTGDNAPPFDDTLNGQLCWDPPCEAIGNLYPVYIQARDEDDCPNHNIAIDTFYVQVTAPTVGPPTLTTNLAANPAGHSGDTVYANLANPQACFTVELRANDTAADLQFRWDTSGMGGSPGWSLTTLTQTDTLIRTRICLEPSCALLDNAARVSLVGIRQDACPPDNQTIEQVYIKRLPDPNAQPTLDVTPTLVPDQDADTVLVQVGEQACWAYELLDTPPSDTLSLSATLTPLDGGPAPSGSLTLSTGSASATERTGDICWTGPCADEGRTFRLDVVGTDALGCSRPNTVRRTVYVRVQPPPNPLPTMVHTLAGLPRRGDTLLVDLDSTICIPYRLTDSLPTRRLFYQPLALLNGQPWPNQPTATDDTLTDTLRTGTLCWTGTCAEAGQHILLVLRALDSTDCSLSHQLRDSLWLELREPPNPAPTLTIAQAGQPLLADTLTTQSDSTLCLDIRLADVPPVSRLNLLVEQLVGFGTQLDPSAVGFTILSRSDTHIRARLCLTLTCAQLTEPIAMLVRGQDSSECRVQFERRDTVWFRANLPPNPPPAESRTFSRPLAATNAPNGERVYRWVADTSVCVTWRLDDARPFSNLVFDSLQLQRLNGQPLPPNLPDLTVERQGDSALVATWCWRPGCDLLGEGFRVILRAWDSSACTQDHRLADTLRLEVVERDLAALGLTWWSQNPELTRNGDTLTLIAKREACLAIRLMDSLNGSQPDLDLFGALLLRAQNGNLPPSRFRLTTDTLGMGEGLQATLCWTPTCQDAGQVFTIRATGYANPPCALSSLEVQRLIHLRVVPPGNVPPLLARQQPSPFQVRAGDTGCYHLTILDPDGPGTHTVRGLGVLFDSTATLGNAATTWLDDQDALRVNVCLSPSCFHRQALHPVIVCVTDTNGCTPPVQVCDTLQLDVPNCTLQLPNAFTPNQDSRNETWGPRSLLSIEDFTLSIFNRWGKVVYQSRGLDWDGRDQNGRPVPEGVYVYRLRYALVGNKSPAGSTLSGPMVEEQAGTVTLFR